MSAQHEESALFAALRTLPAGLYVEVAPAGVQASCLAREFAAAGWKGVALTVAGSGAGNDLDALLAGAGVAGAHWMAVRGQGAVRGHGALRALESWQGSTCRPLAVLVETGPLALPAFPAPAWRETLGRNGYLFAASDDGYHYFVRGDQVALLVQVAEHASLAWRTRLQASQAALVRAQREAAQARSALLMANAKAASVHTTRLEQQIDAIYASTSWKSTKPLRWAARLRRDPGPALHQLRTAAPALLGKLLRRATAKAGAPLSNTASPAMPGAIDAENVVGPHFRTLLRDELDRHQPPVPPAPRVPSGPGAH